MLDLGQLPALLKSLIETLAGANGGVLQVLAVIVSVVGTARLIFKPIMSAARSIVQATANPNDDLILDNIEKSKAYQVIEFVVDYILSIKLPPKK